MHFNLEINTCFCDTYSKVWIDENVAFWLYKEYDTHNLLFFYCNPITNNFTTKQSH